MRRSKPRPANEGASYGKIPKLVFGDWAPRRTGSQRAGLEGRRRGRAGQILLMALSPSLQRIDHGAQALADLRQTIFNSGRHLGIDLADDQTVVLERPELLCEHALGNAGHPTAQLTEALSAAALQVKEDDALPFSVDQIERRLDRAAGAMREIPSFHEVISQ